MCKPETPRKVGKNNMHNATKWKKTALLGSDESAVNKDSDKLVLVTKKKKHTHIFALFDWGSKLTTPVGIKSH